MSLLLCKTADFEYAKEFRDVEQKQDEKDNCQKNTYYEENEKHRLILKDFCLFVYTN